MKTIQALIVLFLLCIALYPITSFILLWIFLLGLPIWLGLGFLYGIYRKIKKVWYA